MRYTPTQQGRTSEVCPGASRARHHLHNPRHLLPRASEHGRPGRNSDGGRAVLKLVTQLRSQGRVGSVNGTGPFLMPGRGLKSFLPGFLPAEEALNERDDEGNLNNQAEEGLYGGDSTLPVVQITVEQPPPVESRYASYDSIS